ncbi:hypothetical protein N8J30_003461 [Salmonella enterica subsp. enterica serovar Newport]|nr:hypothetical protein [Salmonella enterica subsp. enterica serovar Newport]
MGRTPCTGCVEADGVQNEGRHVRAVAFSEHKFLVVAPVKGDNVAMLRT